jgi:predicted DNA-binding ribbon-helix-helix protein
MARVDLDQYGVGRRPLMKSFVVKRSIVISGHKTSVSLEDAFWKGVKEVASSRNITLSDLIASIDVERKHGNLSSAIRLFVLDFYRNQLEETVARASAARLASSA